MRPHPSLQVLDGGKSEISRSPISFITFIQESQNSLEDLLSIAGIQSDVDKKWAKNIFEAYFKTLLDSAPPQVQNLRLKKSRFYQETKVKLFAWICDELNKPYFLRGGDQIIRAMALEHLQSLESIPTLHLVTSIDYTRADVAHALNLP